MNGAALVLCITLLLATVCNGFPDGAPVDTCVKPTPNQPYHGQSKPQPQGTSPYAVVASGSQYGPGTEITVTIEGAVFRGFFLQARDVATNAWIGEWAETPNTKSHPECSAITHGDPKDKQRALLVWRAPKHAPPGQVFFTGTVLKDYGTFWSRLVADVAHH